MKRKRQLKKSNDFHRWTLIRLLTLTGPIWTLQLQRLEGNPGLLPIKEGKAFVQNDKWIILKTLDLEELALDLQSNLDSYKSFDIKISNNKFYSIEFSSLKRQLNQIKEITVNKLYQVNPISRIKRGLLNPMGSLIKIVTGNLDNTDALKYDRIINQMKNQQGTMNQKITLITKMMDKLGNTSSTINENNSKLNLEIKRVENALSEIARKETNTAQTVVILSIYNQLIANFRTLYIRLNEIENALSFSKVAILHQTIMDPAELLTLLQLIEKTDRLIYTANLDNLIKIEQAISVKAYQKSHEIVFILEIPLVENNTYAYYRIYPLPIFNNISNQTLAIFPKFPYLLVNGTQYNQCRSLAEATHLCLEEEIEAYTQDTCTIQLMKFQEDSTACKQYPIKIESLKI